MKDEADTPDKGIGEGDTATGIAERGEDEAADPVVLAKRVKDQEAFISKLQSEHDLAKNDGAKLNQLLEQLVKGQTENNGAKAGTSDEAAQQARVDALVKEVGDAYRKSEDDGARKTLEVFSSYLRDVETRAKDELGLTKKELREHMDGEIAKLHEAMADRDPGFVQVADRVTELATELGLDVKKDRELLVKLANREKPERPERHELPGGGGGGGGRGARASEDAAITPDAETYLTGGLPGGKLTKEERAFLSRK